MHVRFQEILSGVTFITDSTCSHWVRGLRVGSVGLRIGSTKRYQHVSIGNANCSHWGPDPTQSPNGSGFALQWNIGFRIFFPNTLPRSYVIVFKVNIEVFNIAKKDVLILHSYCNAGVDPFLTDLLFLSIMME